MRIGDLDIVSHINFIGIGDLDIVAHINFIGIGEHDFVGRISSRQKSVGLIRVAHM